MQPKSRRLVTEKNFEEGLSPLNSRVEAVETMAGLAPGEVTDAQTANVISQNETQTRSALNTIINGRVAPVEHIASTANSLAKVISGRVDALSVLTDLQPGNVDDATIGLHVSNHGSLARDAVEQVAEDHINDFIHMSPNLFDRDQEFTVGAIRPDGTLNEDVTNRRTTGFIPVEPSTFYSLSVDGAPMQANDALYVRFNEDFEPIGGVSATTPFETTSLTRYARFSVRDHLVEKFQVEHGPVVTPFQPYGQRSMKSLTLDGAGDVASVITELRERVLDLENSPTLSANFKYPSMLLEWEDTGHQVTNMGTSFDGNLYVTFRTDTDGTLLRRSTDGGQTFEPGFSASAVGHAIATFAVFDDGTVSLVGTNGQMWHAESFDATPQLVHETGNGNTLHSLPSTFYQGPNGEKYGFVGEYDHTPTMKNMYYTVDGGRSWAVLKEGGTLHEGNNHWHSVGYDPYRDHIWLSEGDGTNSKIYHTPDWGETWTEVLGTHPTSIHAFPERVTFGRDKSGENPGMDEYTRFSESPTSLDAAFEFMEHRQSYEFYPANTNWNGPDDEYYLLYPAQSVELTNGRIYGTGDGGKSWHLVYEGPEARSLLSGIDNQGYLYVKPGTGANTPLLRAKAPTWSTR